MLVSHATSGLQSASPAAGLIQPAEEWHGNVEDDNIRFRRQHSESNVRSLATVLTISNSGSSVVSAMRLELVVRPGQLCRSLRSTQFQFVTRFLERGFRPCLVSNLVYLRHPKRVVLARGRDDEAAPQRRRGGAL